jgi:archaeosortase B (VPXXXP-CTERM-specific)
VAKLPSSWVRRALLFTVALLVLGGAVTWLTASDAALGWVRGAVAQSTSAVLNLVGQDTNVERGHTVASSRFSISVVTACTGLFLMAVFAAAVLTYPSRWWAKLAGLGIGLGGLYLLNVLRLVCLFFVGVYLPQHVERAHLLVLQSLLIVAALLLWLVWVEKVAHGSIRKS